MKNKNSEAIKIAAIFLIISLLWILFSDKLLESILPDKSTLSQFQTYKGWFYVISASAIIYWLVNREIIKQKHFNTIFLSERNRFKTLFESANDTILIIDSNNKIVECNTKALELFKCSRDQLIGITPFDISPAFQSDDVKSTEKGSKYVEKAFEDQSQKFEWIHTPYNSNEIIYTEISLNAIKLDDKKYIQTIIRDISKRKQLEKELHSTQMHYTDFINASLDQVNYWKAPADIKADMPIKKQVEKIYESVCIDANKISWEFYGFSSKSELIGKKYIELIQEKTFNDAFNKFIKNNYRLSNYYAEEIGLDGKRYSSLLNMYGTIENGELTYIWASSKDITDLKAYEQKLKTKNEEYEALNKELVEKYEELQAAEEELQASNDELAFINERLSESEDRYRLLSELNHEGIIIHSNGIALDVNKAFCDIMGYSAEELIGINIIDKVFTPESAKRAWENIKKSNTKTIILDGIKKDGRNIFLELEGRNIKYQNQNARVVTLRDITDRIKANEALKLSEERFRTVVTNSIPVIFMYDNKGNILLSEGKMLDRFGLKPGEAVGNNIFENYKDYPIIMGHLKKPLNGETYEGMIEFADLTFDAFFSPNKDASGKIIGGIGITSDITERIKTEKALVENEERMRALLNATLESVFLCRTNGEVLTANEIGAKRMNTTPNQIIGKNVFSYFPEDVAEKRLAKSTPVLHTKKPVRFQDERNGKYFDTSIYPVFGDKKEVSAYAIFSRDITDKHLAQKALEASEERYRLLIENGPSVFWITDKNGGTIYISPNIKKIYGYSDKEIYTSGSNLWFDRIHPDDISNVISNYGLVFEKGGKFNMTYRIKHKKEHWVWLHDIGERYVDIEGKEYAYGILYNITESKTSQQKVLHAMIKAEERERSRIAKDLHDGISPVMSAIKLYIQSLHDSEDEKLRNKLVEKISHTINDAIAGINEISNNVSPHILQNFGLKTAIESFSHKISELHPLTFNIDCDINDRLEETIEVAFYRITSELINNTIKYADAKNITIKYTIRNDFIHLIYQDDGKGFDVSSTLNERKGMGLFNMKNRIDVLNGQIDFNSKPGKGIYVTISVPL